MTTPSEFPMAEEMEVRPEFLGLATLIAPFPQHNTSQRLTMWAAQSAQALALTQAEFPAIFTGFEEKVGRYTFDQADIREDMICKRVIPKIRGINANANPTSLVIMVNPRTKVITCHSINRFTRLNRDVGVQNVRINSGLLMPECLIQKGTEFTVPVNKHGSCYCMGVNVNVANVSIWENTDDAVVITDELSERMTYLRMGSFSGTLSPDDIPLNLYGDQTEFACIPDLDREVRPDGFLFGSRKISEDALLADLTDASLAEVLLGDSTFVAHPGARIVDITVHLGNGFRPSHAENPLYAQLAKYNASLIRYYIDILDTYYELREQGYTGDDHMDNTAYVALAAVMLANRRERLQLSKRIRKVISSISGKPSPGKPSKSDLHLMYRKEHVDFIHLNITYAYLEKVGVGSKLSDRHGGKCIVSRVIPKSESMRDERGFVADAIYCSKGGLNRMNPGQYFESDYTRCAEIVRQTALAITDDAKAIAYILEFLNIVSPAYAATVARVLDTPAKVTAYLAELEKTGILHVCVPPYSKRHSRAVVRELKRKYDYKKTQVKWVVTHGDGTKEEVTLRSPVAIGRKYMEVLGKLPDKMISAQEAAYVTQFGLPTKPNTHSKQNEPISKTPVRLGEDETAVLGIVLDQSVIVHLMGVHANSPLAFHELCEALATHPNPSTLPRIGMTLRQIVDTSGNLAAFNHMMIACGYQIVDHGEAGANGRPDRRYTMHIIPDRIEELVTYSDITSPDGD